MGLPQRLVSCACWEPHCLRRVLRMLWSGCMLPATAWLAAPVLPACLPAVSCLQQLSTMFTLHTTSKRTFVVPAGRPMTGSSSTPSSALAVHLEMRWRVR